MNRAPAILQVHSFYRESTGADRYVRDLSTLLLARGHRVAPFCARHDGDDPTPWARYFPEGAATAPGASPTRLQALRDAGKFLHHRRARRRAAAVIADFQPGVVHVHNLFHHLSPAVLAPLRARGAQVVMTLHDYKLICPNYVLHTQGTPCTACRGGHFGHAVARRCVRGSYAKSALCAIENTVHWRLGSYVRHVDRFIAPSRFLYERFLEFGFPGERLSIVPNFTPAAGEPLAPVAEGEFILFAGRLVGIKGLTTLLTAWRATRARRHLRLAIAGDGPLAGALQREASDPSAGIDLLGPLSRAELASRMARAVAVVVPSEWYEPCPLVVLEAQALGRCVIASHIGGIPELVDHGGNGLLTTPGDRASLATAIDRAAFEPGLRARLGAAARRRVERRHGPDRHYETIRALYRGESAEAADEVGGPHEGLVAARGDRHA